MPKAKTIWVVEQNGIHQYDTTRLFNALKYIGERLAAGGPWGLVTTKAAVDAGFSIRQC